MPLDCSLDGKLKVAQSHKINQKSFWTARLYKTCRQIFVAFFLFIELTWSKLLYKLLSVYSH